MIMSFDPHAASLGHRNDSGRPAGLRSGLVPLHPALGSPDMRQALAAQHRQHSSIFGSGWHTQVLDKDIAADETPSDDFRLVAHVKPRTTERPGLLEMIHEVRMTRSYCLTLTV